MSDVTDIWLFVQTATSPTQAASPGHLLLDVVGARQVLPTQNQQEKGNDLSTLGGAAQFHWSQNNGDWTQGAITADDVTKGFTLEIDSDDAWLPSSICVTFLIEGSQYMLGPQCTNWNPNQWFSTDVNDMGGAQPEWPLPWTVVKPVVSINMDQVVFLRKEEIRHVQAAQSTLNQFAGIDIPQNPYMAPNNFGSPHQDSWCSESVSLSGPTGENLHLIEQFNPFGFTPVMACNSNNQMIGVSLTYETNQYWMIVFDEDCNILSATPVGKKTSNTFGGGYFYLDNQNNAIVVQENCIASYPTQDVQPGAEIYSLTPNWKSPDIVQLVTGSSTGNSLYSCMPVWGAASANTYWCLLAGEYNYQDYPESTLTGPAYMAVVQINPSDGTAKLVGSQELVNQWNNNTFSVDEESAYIVTNGVDDNGLSDGGYLWAFELNGSEVSVRWKTPYDNAGYLKPGQKNIGSGTTPTLTMTSDGTEYVAITDNADPQLNVMVCNRKDGSIVSKTPCFEPMRSADEASLVGVQNIFVVENNFGHYPTFPVSQLVPNGPGMTMIQVEGVDSASVLWNLPNVHFYAMNMLCRESGIIFAHTCDWTDDISATKGGMYYVSAIDSFNGRVIWRIPLGRGVNYCHEYGGIYFNHNGDLYIGTNQYLICIKNFQNPAIELKPVT